MSESIDIANDTLPMLGEWKWGDYECNLSELPIAVVQQAVKRALSHVLSSEVSSSVGSKLNIVRGADIDDATKAERERLEHEARVAAIEAFKSGEWATSRRGGPRGPRVDSLTTEYNRILADAVRDVFKSRGIKMDKESKEYRWQVAGSNEVQTRTLDAAVANYEAKLTEDQKAAYMAAAQEAVDAKARAAALRSTVNNTADIGL
jgi:hypothetical protein